MRLYFSFGYDTKKLGLSVVAGEELKQDLVGYGYDAAPVLMYFKIHVLFFEVVVGNLFI